MKAEIKKHIDSMRPELLACANYNSYVERSMMTGSEILEDSIKATLLRPEDQLTEMYNNIVRENYRELDFYIVKMIKINCKVYGYPLDSFINEETTVEEALAINAGNHELRLNAIDEWRKLMGLGRRLREHHD